MYVNQEIESKLRILVPDKNLSFSKYSNLIIPNYKRVFLLAVIVQTLDTIRFQMIKLTASS